MKCGRWLGLAAVLIALAPWNARAEVSLSGVFSDNMMLQREQPIKVWGRAAPGEAVKVALAGKEAAAAAGPDGKWSVVLPALKEGENLELTVAGKNSIVLKNLIVGDVWLCTGQSNMELPLSVCNSKPDVAAADFPKIRHIKFEHATSTKAQDDLPPTKSSWQVCTPKTAGNFTGAGFYFAREVSQKTGVPIGLCNISYGGTFIEPWIAPEGVALVPECQRMIVNEQTALAAARAALPKQMDTFEKWIIASRPQLPTQLEEFENWIVAARQALAKDERLPPQPAPPFAAVKQAMDKGAKLAPMPYPPYTGNVIEWNGIYNAMVHPIVGIPIKGILWYQGETGGDGGPYYDKMRALILGWRKLWGRDDLPFYFVQLPGLRNATTDLPAGGDGFAGARISQTKTLLSVPHTGMAITVDIGETNNVHPLNKQDVGLRLARWALANEYGQKDLVVCGPLFHELKTEGDKLRLSFDYVGGGLMVGKKVGLAPAAEDKEGKLARFAVAGDDKVWQWADAVIDGATVVVSSPKVPKPVAVRYAYSSNPEGANLYNREGLPAAPFRTDNW